MPRDVTRGANANDLSSLRLTHVREESIDRLPTASITTRIHPIGTARWGIKRKAAFSPHWKPAWCQLCRATKKLHVHHNTYENLGNERDEDLIVLCIRCHKAFHLKLDRRTRKKLLKAGEKDSGQPINALPRPPQLARAIKPNKFTPKGCSGVTRKIVASQEYVDSLITPNGGITWRGLHLIGEEVPHKSGWYHRAIGREIEIDEGELAAELEAIKIKASLPVKPNRQRLKHSPSEAWNRRFNAQSTVAHQSANFVSRFSLGVRMTGNPL